jgi:hypothetical protein
VTVVTFIVFTLAGILLWIKDHKGWAVLCFLIALVAALLMLA